MVLPGGAVGFFPCVVVVVGTGVVGAVVVGVAVGAVVPGGAVVVVVGPVVGATVGGTTVVPAVGTVVGAVVGAVVVPGVGAVVLLVDGAGVDELPDGVLDCWDGAPPGVAGPSVGVGVCAAASTGGAVGRCLTAAGAGISGVSSLGPPSKLLAMSTR
ncbi:MAG TPA: hypothetical protein VFF46_02440 [Kribbella sp.]|nr:hypothetical protein [Kribbella sp.]